MNPQLLPLPECSKGDVVETALSFFVQGFDNRITAVAGMNNSLAVQGEYQILKVSLRQSVTGLTEWSGFFWRMVHQCSLFLLTLVRIILAKAVKRVGNDEFIYFIFFTFAAVCVNHFMGIKKGKIPGDPLFISERPPFSYFFNIHTALSFCSPLFLPSTRNWINVASYSVDVQGFFFVDSGSVK